MKKLLLFNFIIIITIISCKTKENCELAHTGNIYITNNSYISAEIYINGANKGNVDANKSITITEPIGKYLIKIKNGLLIKEYPNIIVSECNQTDLSVNFYE